MSEQWIVIPKWHDFQHYSDRDPTWIKTYTRLLHDDEYLRLSSHCRAVLHGIWLAYASANGQLLLTTSSLSSHLALRVMTRDIESLIDAGFVEVSASKPLALRYPREEKKEEKRREEKNSPLPPTDVGGQNGTPRDRGTNPRAVEKRAKKDRHESMLSDAWAASGDWSGGTDLIHERLDAIERDHGGIFTDQERDAIVDSVLERQRIPF